MFHLSLGAALTFRNRKHYRFPKGRFLYSNIFIDAIFSTDDLILHSFDERMGYARGDRRHEVHPVSREQGGKKRNNQNESPCKSSCGGILLHHLSVSQDFSTSNIESLTRGIGIEKTSDQIANYVTQGNRLDVSLHPSRAHHNRQALNEMPKHLE